MPRQYFAFEEWLIAQDYKHKVLIAGNHDGFIRSMHAPVMIGDAHYLEDSGVEIEGLKIWGSPWTPEFCNWYFMKPRGEQIAEKWAQIPDDTNILVTHGPAYGILDYVSNRKLKRHGCEDLYKRLGGLKELKLHVFGHIHGGYGHLTRLQDFPGTQFVNCAHMDEDYKAVNKPIRVIL
jgi:Icc-related predicted phosphoesterase